MLFFRPLIFSKSSFLKNSFKNCMRVSNSLNSDQARHFVGPDLGPNCLRRFSVDATRRQRVYYVETFLKCQDLRALYRSGEILN